MEETHRQEREDWRRAEEDKHWQEFEERLKNETVYVATKMIDAVKNKTTYIAMKMIDAVRNEKTYDELCWLVQEDRRQQAELHRQEELLRYHQKQKEIPAAGRTTS